MLEARAIDNRVDVVVIVFKTFFSLGNANIDYLLNRGASART